MKHQSGGTSALQATENTEWLELFLMSLQRNSSLPVNPKQEAVNVANFLVIAGITWAGVTHSTWGFLHLSCTEMLFHPWFLLLFKEGTTHSSKRATKIHGFAYWWFPKDFKCFNSKIQKYYLFFFTNIQAFLVQVFSQAERARTISWKAFISWYKNPALGEIYI